MRSHRKVRPRTGTAPSFSIESLESRQLLSAAPWSAQDQLIGLDQATQNYPNLTGSGETVAIIDRGVDYNHPELGGGFGPGFKVIAGYDFQDNTGDVFPYDNDAHGTGTAGEIAASPHVVDGQLYQGVAPGVNLVALKTNGTADITSALDWIVAHREQYNIVAINYLDKSNADESAFVPELQSLTDSGVFIAGATGNYGPSTAYGSVNHLINLVGSIDLNGQLSDFSPRGEAVDLVAPGGGVNITWYDSGQHLDAVSSGTSWAAPQVVGTAALIKQINPNFTPAQILSILRDSAQQVWDNASGMNYSELNVNAALGLAYQRSGSAGVVNPTLPVDPVVPVPPVTPVITAPAPVAVSSGTPFNSTAFVTGQTIQAEQFDNGGDGAGFHTPQFFNVANGAYRPATVDFAWSRSDGRSWVVTKTQPGEWLNYTVDAAKSGTFDLTARVASAGVGGTFHFEVDGVDVTGPIAVPNTHGSNHFVNLTRHNISLTAGQHVVKLVIDSAGASGFGANINWFKLVAVRTPAIRHRATKAVAHHAIAGKSSSTVVPSPSLLRTLILPLNRSTMP